MLLTIERPFETMVKRFFNDDLLKIDYRFPYFGKNEFGSTNIQEFEENYLIELNVPGFKKEDINISLENDILTISAEQESKKEEGTYNRKEFERTSIKRSFSVPEDVDKENIDAKCEHGILYVDLGKKKKEEPKNESKSIKIK